jgi:putative membrane protein
MDLLVGSLMLRPYVFAFLALFLIAGTLDIGWRRTLAFWMWVWPIAWIAEFASTRHGIPFGMYHYTGLTRGQELYFDNIPFFDSLSFTFLAYAAFCLARVAIVQLFPAHPGLARSRAALAVLAGVLMMALDLVIDPVAVRGNQWFLGHIFYYPSGGVYFGVPLSNFAGWVIVGTIGVGGYVALVGDPQSGRPSGGVALYYAVIGFNLGVTMWIGEWVLALVGVMIHALIAVPMLYLVQRADPVVGFGRRGMQGA